MKRKLIAFMIGVAALAALSVGIVAAAPSNNSASGLNFKITVTNLTKGQPISPITIATHEKDLTPLFMLGSPASSELAAIAEDADNSGLLTLWDPSTNPDVRDVQVLMGVGTGGPGPIVPGESASIIVNAGGDARRLSMVGMLVSTNDAFTSLQNIDLMQRNNSMHRSIAYDSGSEANNEDCDFIPGPPCGNGGVRDTAGAEGYVYVHSGIHGIDDLVPATHDWRNPVAAIKIERMP